MSILIKGIEMPASCDECYIREKNTCPLTKTNVTGWGRPLNCLLVPVPPHGDLIERKAAGLTDFEIVMCDGNYKEGLKMLLEKIELAPIIIPAEEGE